MWEEMQPQCVHKLCGYESTSEKHLNLKPEMELSRMFPLFTYPMALKQVKFGSAEKKSFRKQQMGLAS